MIKKRIAIRCLTKISKGYGNLSRCMIIAESLRKKGFNFLFIIDSNTLANQELKKRNFDYLPVNFHTIKQENDFLSPYLKQNNFDAIILDMREKGESLSKFLYKKIKIIQFDDAWIKNVYADLLFNGTNVKLYQNYKKINSKTKLIKICLYIPL